MTGLTTHLVCFGSLFSFIFFLLFSLCSFEAYSCLFLVLIFFHLTLSNEMSLSTRIGLYFVVHGCFSLFLYFRFFVIILLILFVMPSRIFLKLFLVSFLLLYLSSCRSRPLFRAKSTFLVCLDVSGIFFPFFYRDAWLNSRRCFLFYRLWRKVDSIFWLTF